MAPSLVAARSHLPHPLACLPQWPHPQLLPARIACAPGRQALAILPALRRARHLRLPAQPNTAHVPPLIVLRAAAAGVSTHLLTNDITNNSRTRASCAFCWITWCAVPAGPDLGPRLTAGPPCPASCHKLQRLLLSHPPHSALDPEGSLLQLDSIGVQSAGPPGLLHLPILATSAWRSGLYAGPAPGPVPPLQVRLRCGRPAAGSCGRSPWA